MRKKLIFLHGFLGSPSDWDPISSYFSENYDCFAPKLSELEKIELNDSHLIGYSMGGRIALELLLKDSKNFHSGVLLSTNPGIHDYERAQRILSEKDWIEKLKTYPLDEFIEEWYSQPLFINAPIPKSRWHINQEEMIELFQKYSIAKQDSFWDTLTSPHPNLTFLFGEKDEKYAKIGRKLKAMKLRVESLKNCSHALHLENPGECINAIEKHLKVINEPNS